MESNERTVDPNPKVSFRTWSLGLFLGALKDSYTYNPVKNLYFWVGFVWGLPIPILFLWFHRRFEPISFTEVVLTDPIHFVFVLHPLLFGFVFGMAGSVLNQYIEQLRNESVRDYLTGLYNHRFFRQELRKRLNEASRYDQSFCLVMFDLDHFKRVNDEFGHQVGDELLQEFADLLQKSTRDSDMVFRYGGEEFTLILPETERDSAEQLAERIREDVAIHDFGIDRQVTVSGGVAEYPEDSTEEMDLIQIVDERLYKAKESGRNVVVSDEVVKSP